MDRSRSRRLKTWVQHERSWSATRERSQHWIFTYKNCWHLQFLEHELSELETSILLVHRVFSQYQGGVLRTQHQVLPDWFIKQFLQHVKIYWGIILIEGLDSHVIALVSQLAIASDKSLFFCAIVHFDILTRVNLLDSTCERRHHTPWLIFTTVP